MSDIEPKHKKRNLFTLMAVVLLAFSGALYLGVQPKSVQADSVTIPMSIQLAQQTNVTAKNGTLLYSQTLKHDLLVSNFFTMLEGFFSNAQSGTSVSESLTTTADASKTVYFWGQTNTGTGNAWTAVVLGGGGVIEVGTGTPTVTRTDYALLDPYQSFFSTSTTCNTGTTDSVTIAGSENAATSTTISESGLFYAWGSSAVFYFMLSHDTFTGISIAAFNTITIQYTLSWANAGFNYNLCNLFAGYLTQPNGQSNTYKSPTSLTVFYDTNGYSVGYSPLCGYLAETAYCNGGTGFTSAYAAPFAPLASSNPVTSQASYFPSGDTVNTVQICIGTGSTAFTPASYSLTSKYACNYVSSVTYDGVNNVYVTTTITLATGATISEAGVYITVPNTCIQYTVAGNSCGSYGSDTTMWMAATFSGQVVANGGAIAITFQITG